MHKEQKSKELKSLQITHPEIAKQWHPTKNGDLKPTDVAANSNKKVWWILPYDDPNSGRHFDFEWRTTVHNRAIRGTKCPYLINQAILPGFNDLHTTNPALAKEWHPVKNKNLTPFAVVGGSSKKVWWKCAHGHEWEATINSRNQGVGCPYCMGKEAITGHNDLQTLNPELAKEWNYEKNNGLTPIQVLPNSNKKVWWKCAHGHEWQANISSRTKGNNCPFCAGQRVIVGYNDLQTVNPALAKEWNYEKNNGLTPVDVMSSSGKKVWWKCSKGHEWQATIYDRNKGCGCPCCSGKKVLQGFNDLQTTRPELLKEWHPTKNGNLKPTDVTTSSNKKVWWVCDKNHEWQATVAARSKGTGCPFCANRKALAGFNDLATVNPTVASEWHPTKNGNLQPSMITCGSSIKVWWKCSKGHEWQATISSRNKGCGCPTCRKEEKTSFPENAIFFYVQKAYPDAIQSYTVDWLNNMEIDIFIPSLSLGIEYDGERWHHNPQRDIRKNILCQQYNIDLIRIREPSCPNICGRNILMTSNSNVELERVIKLLLDKYLQVNVDIDVNITQDATKIRDLTEHLKKCNSLIEQNPTLASEWHPTKNGKLKPEHVSVSSGKKVWWQCREGHEWQANIASRNKGCGCPICANRKILVGFNDLQTLNPVIASEWHPTKNGNLQPFMITCGSTKKVWWKCGVCGHEWKTSIHSRSICGHDCPECAHKTRRLTYKNRVASEHINQINTMNCGLKCKIIHYDSSTNIIVRFESGVEKQTSYSDFKKGTISPDL